MNFFWSGRRKEFSFLFLHFLMLNFIFVGQLKARDSGENTSIKETLGAGVAVIPDEKEFVQSLDGAWRFKLEQNKGFDKEKGIIGNESIPVDYPKTFEPFYKTKYTEGAEWVNLAVPGTWEMAGLSPATYNQPDNSSGFYRLWFDVPKSWKGREVRINFDGVQNGAEIWLNGKPVPVSEPSWGRMNYHESGWTAFQADLTSQVKYGSKNLLAVRVTKNTRSSDMDSGDYFFLGGIYRTVTLFSVPKEHISDYKVETRLLKGNLAEVKVIASIVGNEASTLAMKLGDLEKSGNIKNNQVILVQVLKKPKLWSAEFPNLYPLSLELKDKKDKTIETVSKPIGIREVTIENGVLLLNGVPVKFAGVCRQDMSAEKGTAVDMALWEEDIRLMKAANINAIRTSHYPYGSGFYDLCDQLGMYVADELPYCWCATDDPETRPSFEQRARETLWRDKNHPSVILWSIGNENKEGENLQVVSDLVTQLDNTRPSAQSRFMGDKYNTKLSDSHYPAPSKMETQAKEAVKTGQPHVYLETPNSWDIRLAADPGAWERWGPVLQRTWDVCVKYPTIPGIFFWEWQDRGIVDSCATKYYLYYPETGINIKKIKGIVDAFRNPRPWYYEVKMVYSPICVKDTFSLKGNAITFPVENRYSFTELSYLNLNWSLEQNGKTIKSGSGVANIPPLKSGDVKIQLPAATLQQADALRVEFVHPDGNHIVSHRFVLKEISEKKKIDFTNLESFPIPAFNLISRKTEKDKQVWRRITRSTAGLTNVVIEPASANNLKEFKKITADVVLGPENKVVGILQAEFCNGEFKYRLEWTGDETNVQELGWAFPVPEKYDNFSWNRKSRWTDYPAHHISRPVGTAKPGTMDVPVTKMDRVDAYDFNSTKYDCNQASLTSDDGKGIGAVFSPEQRYHCRAGAGKNGGFVLFVNKQVSPPDDLSSGVVQDFYLKMKTGDVIEGSFRIGAVERK